MAIERSADAFFREFGSDVLGWLCAISDFRVSFSVDDSSEIFNMIAELSRVCV